MTVQELIDKLQELENKDFQLNLIVNDDGDIEMYPYGNIESNGYNYFLKVTY